MSIIGLWCKCAAEIVCEQIRQNGGVAQLGEHLPCKQGVMGSNPIISTSGEIRKGNEP